MHKINCRVSESTLSWMLSHFDNKSGAGEWLLEAFPVLYRRTLHEMLGRFERGELLLVMDVMNGHLLTPGMSGQSILLECEDAIRLDSLDKKWGVNKKQFLGKLSKLHPFERSCLELWGRGFWTSGTYERDNGDDEWLAALSL